MLVKNVLNIIQRTRYFTAPGSRTKFGCEIWQTFCWWGGFINGTLKKIILIIVKKCWGKKFNGKNMWICTYRRSKGRLLDKDILRYRNSFNVVGFVETWLGKDDELNLKRKGEGEDGIQEV